MWIVCCIACKRPRNKSGRSVGSILNRMKKSVRLGRSFASLALILSSLAFEDFFYSLQGKPPHRHPPLPFFSATLPLVQIVFFCSLGRSGPRFKNMFKKNHPSSLSSSSLNASLSSYNLTAFLALLLSLPLSLPLTSPHSASSSPSHPKALPNTFSFLPTSSPPSPAPLPHRKPPNISHRKHLKLTKPQSFSKKESLFPLSSLLSPLSSLLSSPLLSSPLLSSPLLSSLISFPFLSFPLLSSPPSLLSYFQPSLTEKTSSSSHTLLTRAVAQVSGAERPFPCFLPHLVDDM